MKDSAYAAEQGAADGRRAPDSPKPAGMTRRRALASLLAPALCAGCGDNAIGNNVISLIRGRVTGGEAPHVTRDYAAKLPYASMSARFGGRDAALMVLARVQDRDLIWRAGKQVIFVTRAGRLVQTGGLPNNLRSTWIRAEDPLAFQPQRLDRPIELVRTVDIQVANAPIQTLDLRSTLAPVARRTIAIYGLSFDTLELSEKTRAVGGDWEFTDRFWVDARTGLTWQSLQTIAPDVPAILTQLMKPPQSELDALATPPRPA